MIEDEAYFRTVSRYIHLNPVPALVPSPALWPWSSYVGFVDPRHRLPWIQYDRLLDAWEGGHARRVLALLAHQLSTATLREISTCLGLSGPDSVHKLIKRTVNDSSAELRASIQNVRSRLLLP